MNVFDYSDEQLQEFVTNTCKKLTNAVDSAEAVALIKEALQHYTIFDLQYIGGVARREVEKLPEPYRGRYRPYSNDLLNRYHEFIELCRFKKTNQLRVRDRKLWDDYWFNADEMLFQEANSDNDPLRSLGHPAGKFFYRLVYGYTMLLADEPGHPVGMPFPGGWTVKEKGGKILCPIREKEKDLPQALCNYCPAIQDENCL